MGAMREYEMVLILRNGASEDAVTKVIERIHNPVKESGGVILATENWGRKQLAYEIQKQSKGNYFLVHVVAPSETVRRIERQLKLDETVLRHMTVKLDDNVDPQARAQSYDEEKKAAAQRAAEESADESASDSRRRPRQEEGSRRRGERHSASSDDSGRANAAPSAGA